jgi:hypothetical protein
VEERHVDDWLAFGIPVKEPDLVAAENKFSTSDSDYDYHEEWKRPNEQTIAQSNRDAVARVARLALTQVAKDCQDVVTDNKKRAAPKL